MKGRYIGAKANLAIGAGGGVAVLLGGGNDSIALQPLVIEETKGTGIAAGIGFLILN